jgi:electron transfer flavoprotein alpha subunit
MIPRLATKFDAGLASDVVNFVMDGGTFAGTRPLFAGKCLAKVEINGPKPHFVTIRPNALGMPESPAGGSAGGC